MQSVLADDHPLTYALARQVNRFGVNLTVFITTSIIVFFSLTFTSICLHIFQGYIDLLGIVLCTVAPILIFPVPAWFFFQTFVKLQDVEMELLKKNEALEEALKEVNTLSGLLPICCCCKKIRDDQGYWKEVEQYIEDHSRLKLTHGFCPDCVNTMYPEFSEQILDDRADNGKQ